MKKILVVSTTTHEIEVSTSVAMLAAVLRRINTTGVGQVKAINADKLHIVENLSCYANGKKHCADPQSGPYRCWAHHSSVEDPKKYGGVDEMPVIYDGLAWADVVIFATSTRWGSHSALMQKIIERMNTLENRATGWGEPFPMAGKRCGIIVGGLNWKSQQVAEHLQEALSWWKFDMPRSNGTLVWQYTRDLDYEQPGNLKPSIDRWLASDEGQARVNMFVAALCGSV